MQKDLLDEGGGTYLKKTFSISYTLYSRNSVLTHNYQSVLAECEKHFRVNLRAKPAVFSRENIIFFATFI